MKYYTKDGQAQEIFGTPDVLKKIVQNNQGNIYFDESDWGKANALLDGNLGTAGVTYQNYLKSLDPNAADMIAKGYDVLSDEDRMAYEAQKQAEELFNAENPEYQNTEAYKKQQAILNDMLNIANTQGLTNYGQEAKTEQDKAFNESMQNIGGATQNQSQNAWQSLASKTTGADSSLAGILARNQADNLITGKQGLRASNQEAQNQITSDDEALKKDYASKYAQGAADLESSKSAYNLDRNTKRQATVSNAVAAARR